MELPICADKSETIWVVANVQGSYGADAYTYDVNGLVKKHRFVSQDGHGSWGGIYSDAYTYNKKNQVESSKSAEKIKPYGGGIPRWRIPGMNMAPHLETLVLDHERPEQVRIKLGFVLHAARRASCPTNQSHSG